MFSESKPLTHQRCSEAQQTLCAPDPDPTEMETELGFECLSWSARCYVNLGRSFGPFVVLAL